MVIGGDLNSNIRWDRWWNHSDVVKELEEIDIKSLYHNVTNEKQGKESNPTFFLQRKLEKPYHIDYIFISVSLINVETTINIGKVKKWLEFSDHLPIFSKF